MGVILNQLTWTDHKENKEKNIQVNQHIIMISKMVMV